MLGSKKYEIKEKPNGYAKFLLLILSPKQLDINDLLKCPLFIRNKYRTLSLLLLHWLTETLL